MERWTVEDTLVLDGLEGVDSLSVEIVQGEVAVTATNEPTSRVEVKTDGRPVEIEHDGGSLLIRNELPGDNPLGRLRRRATVVVSVPASTRVRVSTVAASALIAGVAGRVSAKSVSGEITLDDLAGDVTVKTVSGSIAARGLSGAFEASGVSGQVILADSTSPSIKTTTVSGSVTIDVEPPEGGRYDLRSTSGGIAVRVPDNPNLSVYVVTMSGGLRSTLPIKSEGHSRKRYRATFGDGSATLTVKTVSGGVSLVGGRASEDDEDVGSERLLQAALDPSPAEHRSDRGTRADR